MSDIEHCADCERLCADCERLKRTLDTAHADWRAEVTILRDARERLTRERDEARQQLRGAVDALRSIAGKSRPSGEYCQRVARLALEKLGDEHYTPRGQ